MAIRPNHCQHVSIAIKTGIPELPLQSAFIKDRINGSTNFGAKDMQLELRMGWCGRIESKDVRKFTFATSMSFGWSCFLADFEAQVFSNWPLAAFCATLCTLDLMKTDPFECWQ